MNNFERYLNFCRVFQNYNIPKIKFKELNECYKLIYTNTYNINEDAINKSSFFVFILSLVIITLLSIFFTYFNILIIIFYSLIISILISYKFNLKLYNGIHKSESILNALLFLIKIDFSLIQKTLNNNSDHYLNFILLIKNYNLPISEKFKIILRKIHEGKTPEDELVKIITPSEDFNRYIRDLLINNFNYKFEFNDLEWSSSEKKIKIYLRDIESKISIIFFIGLFFPVGLCFIILFLPINSILLIFFIPFFLIFLKVLFNKLIKIDIFLIGLLKDHSNIEKRKFDEFLLFLKSFSINLKNNVSPEKAFINSYLENKNHLNLLKEQINKKISLLLNFSCSFAEILNSLGFELKSIRYKLILDAVKKMVEESAYYSSQKIYDLLSIIYKHRKLERKLEVLINGEKFKVFIFLFLLPIIIGAMSGMLPFFNILINNLNYTYDFSNNDYLNLINLIDVLLIFFTLLFSNFITSYYFLKIIHYEKRYFIILIANMFFILTFFLSFLNILLFF